VTTHYPTAALDRPTTQRIRLGVAQTLSAPLRYGAGGALLAPTSGTISILRPDGSSLVSSAAVTVAGSLAYYDLSAPAATEPTGDGWSVVWRLVISGATDIITEDAVAVSEVARPVISERQILVREPELGYRYPQGLTTWQGVIDAAWEDLVRMTDAEGRPLDLNRVPSATYDAHLYHSLELCYQALTVGIDSAQVFVGKVRWYSEKAKIAIGLMAQRTPSDAAGDRSSAGPYRLAPAGRPTW
jgi:hypothetical protein